MLNSEACDVTDINSRDDYSGWQCMLTMQFPPLSRSFDLEVHDYDM